MASKKKKKKKKKEKKKSKKKAGAKPRATAKAKSARPARSAAKKKKATKAKRRPARKRVAATAKPAAPRPEPQILDEVIEEPLLDVSAILRVKDQVARTQRDVDEDELKQFSDPSLVVEAQSKKTRTDDTEETDTGLPDLFAAEARRQAARPAPASHEGSIFHDDPASDEPDED